MCDEKDNKDEKSDEKVADVSVSLEHCHILITNSQILLVLLIDLASTSDRFSQ